MTIESLLKETEDGTDEELVNERGIVRIKPSTVKDKKRAKIRNKEKKWLKRWNSVTRMKIRRK